MKHTALSHIKTMRLQQQLGLRLYEAIGLLELLFQRTAESAWLHGEIGWNRSNADIGLLLDYVGDPEELIAALVSAGYLDEHDTYRFVVHDWRDHCPQFVLKRIARAEKEESDFQESTPSMAASGSRCPPTGGQTGTGKGIGTGTGVGKGSGTGEGKSKHVRFRKPTLEEIRDHCREKGFTFDPEQFLAYYESNGWRIGRTSMKNWQAACLTWHKNTRKNHGRRSGNQQKRRVAKAEVSQRGAF